MKTIKVKIFDGVMVLLAIVIGKILLWSVVNILLFAFFVWAIINPISSRVSAFIFLLLLSVTPLALVIFKNKQTAEYLAIYAYYFLVMTVIMGFYEIRSEKSESLDESENSNIINK